MAEDLFPFPLRAGFIFPLQSLELSAGPDLFDGLTGFSVTPEVDGEAMVYAQGTKPYARTHGRLKVAGSVKMILDPAIDVLKAEKYSPLLSYQFPAITATLKDGTRRDKFTLTWLRLLQFPFDLTGTDAVEVDLKFTAFDFLHNDKSVIRGAELGLSQAGA
jgi:hypothetical protein